MTKLTPAQISEMAKTLHRARCEKFEVEPFSKEMGTYDLEDAYKVQAEGINLRIESGEKIIGYKMGLTSKAKMEQMGLHTPIFGVLTNVMHLENHAPFSLTPFLHPKAEPEIYFITNQDLSGSLSLEDVPRVCEKIGVALEILDSRYKGFKYFSLPDVIADNASSSHFVLGDSVPGSTVLDWPQLKIDLLSNTEIVESATGDAILGHPFLSLCSLVELLAQNGKSLPKGSVVLAGAATIATALQAEQIIKGQLQNVGSAVFPVVP
ncbi:MAG: 4-oxalocrotonate decarboxylase [Bdellovibrionaceae bacterium]|nr:4-oxalocrotonate decarboxylase [Pseudobdellovibrionaceae bacterium]